MSKIGSRVSLTSIRFKNFKALSDFSLSLQDMNILVGTNNCGKSTIISSLRVLEYGIKTASRLKATYVESPSGSVLGYRLSTEALPISTENVHTEYADTDTTVKYTFSNRNHLLLYFPRDGGCILIPQSEVSGTWIPRTFKAAFPININVVPVLGPVEHNEQIVQDETIKRGLTTHRASRHFRNYWYYNPEGFDSFAEMIMDTWPGMTIRKPEKPDVLAKYLVMFCEENRIPRELFWAGFGFQVWCQLLTHIVRSKDATVVAIDEPEIYLHPDVQRQLLGILRDLRSDVIIATHSTELIGEADPSDILLVDKHKKSASRLKKIENVQDTLDAIGSIHNMVLTQLARTRRVVFVEGIYDFSLLRRFARQAEYPKIATGEGLSVVESGGFSSWEKLAGLGWGIQQTLGTQVDMAAVYDRDYWCDEELDEIESRLLKHLKMVFFLGRKEVENYLLEPEVLRRATERAISERARRKGEFHDSTFSTINVLKELTDGMKDEIQAQFIAKRANYLRSVGSSKDLSTITQEAIRIFDAKWLTIEGRIKIAPGKRLLRAFRQRLQDEEGVTIKDWQIVSSYRKTEIPRELVDFFTKLEIFREHRKESPPTGTW